VKESLPLVIGQSHADDHSSYATMEIFWRPKCCPFLLHRKAQEQFRHERIKIFRSGNWQKVECGATRGTHRYEQILIESLGGLLSIFDRFAALSKMFYWEVHPISTCYQRMRWTQVFLFHRKALIHIFNSVTWLLSDHCELMKTFFMRRNISVSNGRHTNVMHHLMPRNTSLCRLRPSV
jgi:hypothetical protein